MQSHIKSLPLAKRPAALEKMKGEITAGTHDPVLLLKRELRGQQRGRMNTIMTATSVGVVIGGIGGLIFAGIPGAIVMGGLVLIGGSWEGLSSFHAFRRDIKTDQFDRYLSQDQIEELLNTVQAMREACTPQQLADNDGFLFAEDLLHDVTGGNYQPINLEGVETVDTQAVTVLGEDQADAPGADSSAKPTDWNPSDAIDLIAKHTNREALSAEIIGHLKRFLCTNPMHMLLVAATGGGKGFFLSNMARFRAEHNPSYLCYWIDPKNNPKETGYMAHSQILAYRFDITACDPIHVAEHMDRAIKNFKTICTHAPAETPMQLVLDEWYLVQEVLEQGGKECRSALKNLYAAIISAISVMDSDFKHIVLVSQSPKINDVLPGGGGIASNLLTVALFKGNDQGYKTLDKCCQCHVIPQDFNGLMELKSISAKSLANRAMFFNNQMWPAPKLTNYARDDRDSRMANTDFVEVEIKNLAVEIDDGAWLPGVLGRSVHNPASMIKGWVQGEDVTPEPIAPPVVEPMDLRPPVIRDEDMQTLADRISQHPDGGDVVNVDAVAMPADEPADVPDLDALLGDDGEAVALDPTPVMDASIKRWQQSKGVRAEMLTSLLIELKRWQGTDKSTVTSTVLNNSTWADRWYKAGELKGKNMTSFRPWLELIKKAKFLESLDENRYQVIYR